MGETRGVRPRALQPALPGRTERASNDDHPHALRSLQEAAAELASAWALDRVAAIVAEASRTTLDTRLVVIAIHEESGGPLRAVYAAGLPDAARRRLPAMLAEASSLAGNGWPDDPSLRSAIEAASGMGALAAVIPPAERPQGVIVVGRGNGRSFSEEERVYLEVLAALCALGVERLRRSIERSQLRAMLRRRLDLHVAGSRARVGDMEVDLGQQEVVIGDRRVSLTPSEIRLLVFLAEEPGRPRSRGEILRRVWHTEHVGDERACDVHISNLRRKIERDPSSPERVVTVRGVGYSLQPR